ncbi:MAG: phage tail protein [Janthinobacterium lividum]
MSDLFEPAVAHRFLASLFFDDRFSPMDIRFQRISGLHRQLDITQHREGGNNVGSVHFPERVTHGNLVLERGVMTLTPLTLHFEEAMSRFRTRYLRVIVLLLNQHNAPVCSWTFVNALPLSWQTGDLDANGSRVLINTLELAYEEMHWLGTKA